LRKVTDGVAGCEGKLHPGGRNLRDISGRQVVDGTVDLGDDAVLIPKSGFERFEAKALLHLADVYAGLELMDGIGMPECHGGKRLADGCFVCNAVQDAVRCPHGQMGSFFASGENIMIGWAMLLSVLYELAYAIGNNEFSWAFPGELLRERVRFKLQEALKLYQ
jgi:hypothetical protein